MSSIQSVFIGRSVTTRSMPGDGCGAGDLGRWPFRTSIRVSPCSIDRGDQGIHQQGRLWILGKFKNDPAKIEKTSLDILDVISLMSMINYLMARMVGKRLPRWIFFWGLGPLSTWIFFVLGWEMLWVSRMDASRVGSTAVFWGANITTTPICSAVPNACRICCPRCPRAVLWSTPHVWKWCMRQICWRSWRLDQISATSAMLRPRTLSRSRLRSMWSVSMCGDRIGHQEGIGKVCCRCKTLKATWNLARNRDNREIEKTFCTKIHSAVPSLSDLSGSLEPIHDASCCQAAVGDKFGKRLIFTKKKMGAQTAEANDNAGVAAANQIVGFFEKGETRFSLKA